MTSPQEAQQALSIHLISLRGEGDQAMERKAPANRDRRREEQAEQAEQYRPSEHTINGERFAVEQHMVHFSDDGNISGRSPMYVRGAVPDDLE